MIDFKVKSSGEILDIAPDASFQIEYENSIFEDDRCPLAFSTEISFLPTQKNKKQLGYLAAMLLPPSVKELDVEVYASGIKILDGMLRFSSVKDGRINYTFLGRSLEDDWSGKIYEKQIHSVSGDVDELHEDIVDIRNGDVEGIYAPLLVNASETDQVVFSYYPEKSDCSFEIKYHNYPFIRSSDTERDRVFTPAISVMKILESELEGISIESSAISELLNRTVVLGQYKTDFAATPSGIPSGGLDLARALPDITALELFRIILKMFCCALFRDGDTFSVRNVSQIILDDSGVLDWDEKISRDAEISTVPSGGYKFSFGNGADEDFNPNETVTTVESFKDTLEDLQEEEIYQSFKHSSSKNIISARKAIVHIAPSGQRPRDLPVYLCDLLSTCLDNFDFAPETQDGDIFDNSVSAKLARSVPDLLQTGNIGSGHWRMAALINPENIGDKRGSDVIIGKIDGVDGEQQLGDGVVYYEDDTEIVADSEDRLATDALFDNYHYEFSRWCRSAHQVVSSDLKLSIADIASFRMWKKVSFAGRTWLARKLTVTFYAGNGRCDVSGEFVSVR